ncbi:MAG: hypothetical protein HY402_04400 [Elusimicrobia bacterium]|nr:hypothetical protein [Elusimicrobiota bacterium]
MSLTWKEFWAVFHGLLLGSAYLLAFAGGLAEFWNLRKRTQTPEGALEAIKRLKIGAWAMAAVCWFTVISGTYLVYPWYRAKGLESPRSKLLADPEKMLWHTFGMEWKEHVAWLSPILATAAAFLVSYYGVKLMERENVRQSTMIFFIIAFVAAAVAGIFGAFINKVAPVL